MRKLFRNNDDRDIFGRYQQILSEALGQGQLKTQMDPDVFKQFEDKLTSAKYKLYRDYPFFGILLTKLKIVPTDSIDTMAVDNYSNIYINPDFVINKLSPDEVMGVLAHEVMHIATLSFFRQGGRGMELWNISTDYIMNRDLLEMGIPLPNLGLIPKQNGDKWSIDMEGLGTIDITDETAEGLHDKLKKKISDEIKKGLTKKQEQLDKHLSPEEADNIKPSDIPSDDPSYKPNKPGEGQPQKTDSQKQSEAKSKVQDALQTAERTRGEGAGIPRSFNKKLLQPKTDYKKLLKDFIRGASKRSYNWTKPQKKGLAAGYYAPRVQKEISDLDIVVAVDTSGSIGPDILGAFVNEISKIVGSFTNVKLNLLLWADTVYHEAEVDTKVDTVNQVRQKLEKLPFRSGGTTFGCIKTYLDKKYPGKKFNGLVVFTDGYIEANPLMPNTQKKLFLINEPGGSEEILKRFGPTHSIEVDRS